MNDERTSYFKFANAGLPVFLKSYPLCYNSISHGNEYMFQKILHTGSFLY